MVRLPSLRVVPVALVHLAACGSPPEPAAPAPATSGAISAPAETAPAPATSAAVSAPAETAAAPPLTVPVEARSGSGLSGSVTLSDAPGGVSVRLTVSGVTPGKHGAHVHERGDCSAPDGASAGGHFNPGGHAHALPQGAERHLGDLGNVEVGADGKGTLQIVVAGASLREGDPSSFLGRSLIVHEKEDDGGQPSGNAGGRIGCAVLPR